LKLVDYDLGLGTITVFEETGIDSYDCIQITTPKWIIRAVLPGHLSEARRNELSASFANFLEEFTDAD
jgi:hypothetical protein